MVFLNSDGTKLLKDQVAKLMSNRIEVDNNNYFKHSISAYFVLAEVYEMLKIDEIPSKSVQNGNVSKIFSEGNKIINAKFGEKGTRELLKYYMARSFFDDYDVEGDDFTNEVPN